jgi:predicted nucleic acid-binding protein
LEELKTVVDYPKFRFTNAQKDRFLKIVISVSIIADTDVIIHEITDDPADNMFLEIAYQTGAD